MLKDRLFHAGFRLIFGASLLAVAAVTGITGQYLFRRGWETRCPSSSSSPAVVLTAEQEAMLRAIDALQVQFAAAKLILLRNGDVMGYGETAKPLGRNLVADVLKESPPPSEQSHERFVKLIESIPAQYLRLFPETRFGNPFVVSMTEDGRRYLRR
jgi:hypothetical protein